MGILYLCSHGLAFVPYYIETIALNIYSLEELCYYLKQNIDLVEPSFINDDLLVWIKEELKLSVLAEKLYELKKEDASLSEFIGTIAEGCNYCTKEEIEKMKEAVADFENKNETECRKIRADRLLQKKRYGASILEYRKLLRIPEISASFAGDIYHNLGTAYARLFLFQEAAVCYEKAFAKNGNPLSASQQQEALKLLSGEMFPEKKEDGEVLLPEEKLKQWKDAYLKNCK